MGLLDPPGLTKAVGDATYAPVNLVADGITYNPDGSVASSTEGGITTTYTWNPDGSVHTETRLGKVKTWTYDGSGNPISSTVTEV
jgi:YD repeat-containing protein